jgi:hypothetical protein
MENVAVTGLHPEEPRRAPTTRNLAAQPENDKRSCLGRVTPETKKSRTVKRSVFTNLSLPPGVATERDWPIGTD